MFHMVDTWCCVRCTRVQFGFRPTKHVQNKNNHNSVTKVNLSRASELIYIVCLADQLVSRARISVYDLGAMEVAVSGNGVRWVEGFEGNGAGLEGIGGETQKAVASEDVWTGRPEQMAWHWYRGGRRGSRRTKKDVRCSCSPLDLGPATGFLGLAVGRTPNCFFFPPGKPRQAGGIDLLCLCGEGKGKTSRNRRFDRTQLMAGALSTGRAYILLRDMGDDMTSMARRREQQHAYADACQKERGLSVGSSRRMQCVVEQRGACIEVAGC